MFQSLEDTFLLEDDAGHSANHSTDPVNEAATVNRPHPLLEQRESGEVSRRTVLKGIGMVFVGTPIARVASTFLGPESSESQNATEDLSQFETELNEIQTTIETLKQVYDLDVFVGPPGATMQHAAMPTSNDGDRTRYQGEALTVLELHEALQLLMQQIIKYPHDFFRNNGIQTIRFLNNPVVNGRSYGGGYASDRYKEVGISFDTSTTHPNEHRIRYFNTVFHHEVFHIADFYDEDYESLDDIWESLHNCSCQVYENVHGRDERPGISESPLEWFAHPYGQVNAREDRAVMADALMDREKHLAILDRITSGGTLEEREILRQKYNLIRQAYFEYSGGQMDNAYWLCLLGLEEDCPVDYFAESPN